MPHFKVEDMSFPQDENGVRIPICPTCVHHNWREDRELHLDCKNTYTAKNGYDGQCCCYSKEHGLRD